MARSNTNAKGRNRTPPFVMLEKRMIATPAWAGLSGNAAKVLVAMVSLYNGENNGQLFLSERHAATMAGIARNTAGKALAELEAAGFIVATQRGHFTMKVRHATQWRLTFHRWDYGPATHDYREPK